MKKILFLLFVICLFSCKEKIAVNNLYFENPQPFGDAELKKVPDKFLGLYQDEDSVFIQIDKNIITKYKFRKFRIHITELDSLKDEMDLVNGKLIDSKTKFVFEMKKIGDSLELSNKNLDTIFMFSENQKIKRIKDNLILNYKEERYWYVNILSLNKNQLRFRYISIDDLAVIDSITSKKSTMIDSSSILISPSRKEFKRVLRKKLGAEILYKKI